MQVRPFELEPEPRTDPPEETAARPAMRATREGEGEEPRDDETIDEPGYGHGV